ncbi:globin domain-containing protein [Nocardia sp. NPDC058379]|uniref:globin domain-containing protein n=1 Tax=unclassified Nocardia TaxID=2637762 RepID=UPI00365A6747
MTEPTRVHPELAAAQAEIVRATLPAIGAAVDEITTVFYRTLFGNHPDLLRDLFNRGNQAQGSQPRALAASIAMFATYLVDPALPHPAAMLRRIGHKHASLGITADQYQVVHDNLFAAIVEVLGAEVVTAPVADAWDRVYWLMADALIDLEKQLYTDAGVQPGRVFRAVTVTERVDDPAGVAVFRVRAVDPAEELPGFVAGQYISVGVRLSDGGRQLRQYSLIGAGGDGTLSFAVKPVAAAAGCPAGEVSSWLHEQVTTGDTLEISLPFGDLTIDPDADTPLVLISAGIGVTPMVGILEHLAARDPGRPVQVLHADRQAATHPLRARVLDLADRLARAEVAFWYTEGAEGTHRGRLDLSAVTLPGDAEIYVCGGDAFLDGVRAQLATAGVPAGQVHIEQFTPTDWRR